MATYGGFNLSGGWGGSGAANDWSQPSNWAQGGGIYGGAQPQQQAQAQPYQQASYNQQAQAQPYNQQAQTMTPAPAGGGNQSSSIGIEDIWNFLSGGNKGGGGLFGGGNQNITQTINPWEPQGEAYKKLFAQAQKHYNQQMNKGPVGFSDASKSALRRMEDLARQNNPLVTNSLDAVNDISSGRQDINQALYSNLWNNPGTSTGQYQQMAQEDPINLARFQQMAGESPITGIGQYNNLAAGGGINGIGQYRNMANEDAITNEGMWREMQNRTQGPGSLQKGMFGKIASGGLVDANPYRESNIKQSMGDTAKAIKASMSKAGRYGSDAYGDAMSKGLSSVATQAREAGYNQDTANMMAAAQARSGEILARQGQGLQVAQGISGLQGANQQQRLAALQGMTGAQNAAAQNQLAAMGARGQAQLSNQQSQFAAAQALAGAQQSNQAARLAALQGLTGAQGQNVQQRLAAAQGLQGVQGQNIANRLAAAGMAGQMNDLRYADANKLLGVGGTREAMQQQQRNFGWDQMNQLRGIYGNLPGSAGQTLEPGKPWWQQLAGLGMTGLGMFGGMQ